jgi:phosphoribosylformylglycinamidine synthase
MVGPWQVPVADVAVTLDDFAGVTGQAMAIGERTPLALIDGPASGRIAVAEALTNLAAAAVRQLSDVKLSATWMAAAGHAGDDAALYDTVRAVAIDLCIALGISIPVGKDSLSMRTTWRDGDVDMAVTAPVSLIVSAFAHVENARATMTPLLRSDAGATMLVHLDIANGRRRLGASALAQVHGQLGNDAPDVDDTATLGSFFALVRRLHADGALLAYHDISDGGLFVTLAEMAFASRCGLAIDLPVAAGDGLAALFAEEPGAVVQVREHDVDSVITAPRGAGIGAYAIGGPAAGRRVVIRCRGEPVFDEPRADLHRAWSATTHAMQRLRDNPLAADQEHARIGDESDAGLVPLLTFDPDEAPAAPFIAKGARPRVAILREQGVNGQVEMAAAFTRAGFDAFDVHMTDIAAGRHSLRDFHGAVACGGFSYGDVLGAGEGWAKSILFNARLRDEFAAFFAAERTFALGVCNGCQMMSNLHQIIPGTDHWPHFVRNASEQFEARFVMLEVMPTPSLFFDGMHGSRIPVALAHGEGYAEFRDAGQLAAAAPLVALRFVDHRGRACETYPYNPNGSPQGITGLTTADGRFTILMPHPERVWRTAQMSWHPGEWGDVSPWYRMFANARRFVGLRLPWQREEKHDDASAYRLLDQRRHAGRRPDGVRASLGGADRRRDRRRRLLYRTVRLAARRFRTDRHPCRGEPAGWMCRARLPRNRHGRRRGRPYRARGRAARLHRRAQCARRHERRRQRQRRHRGFGDRRGNGVRQGEDDRACAHARRRGTGADRPRADASRARLEDRRNAQLPAADAAQSRDDAADDAAFCGGTGPPAHRAAGVAAAFGHQGRAALTSGAARATASCVGRAIAAERSPARSPDRTAVRQKPAACPSRRASDAAT